MTRCLLSCHRNSAERHSPIRTVVTRVFRKRGSSTTEGLRPHLIIVSLQHSSNLVWLGCFVSIVCPLPRQGRFASALPSPHRSTALSGYPPMLYADMLWICVGKAFCSGHVMLIVILHTMRQPFPCQLLFSKCWGPCDIRRKPSPNRYFLPQKAQSG